MVYRVVSNLEIRGAKPGGATALSKWQFSYISSPKKNGFPKFRDRSCPFAPQLAFEVKTLQFKFEIVRPIRGGVIRSVRDWFFAQVYCLLLVGKRLETLAVYSSVTIVVAVEVSCMSHKTSWFYGTRKLLCEAKFAIFLTVDGVFAGLYLRGVFLSNAKINMRRCLLNVLFAAVNTLFLIELLWSYCQ